MNNKILNQLTQFKCYTYEEWLSIGQTLPPPLRGEVCAVIIQNDTDIKTNFPIPDGYELLDPPYTLLKVGDGQNNIFDLPWVSTTESEVV
jgi:hypothetical protein